MRKNYKKLPKKLNNWVKGYIFSIWMYIFSFWMYIFSIWMYIFTIFCNFKNNFNIYCIHLKNIKNILKIREEKNIPLKGEIVLVVAGISQLAEFDIKKIRESIRNKLNTMSLKDTVVLISTEERISKKLIYKEAIKIKDKF